jgi:predicted phosphate transport protein (TIGR00153 family)
VRLDKIIQTLLPHDRNFYNFFSESVINIRKASEVLIKLPDADQAERERLIAEIGELEHVGDDITHKIINELNATFVTPFDPEDIHLLASVLDDILDNIDGSARRFALYKIQECPPHIAALMSILHSSICELEEGIGLIQGFKQPLKLGKIIERVNKYENDADEVFSQAVAHLFENVTDPIEIIKIKEILVALETATDKCEDVADVIETIIIKHA